jgi:hypothetical protein
MLSMNIQPTRGGDAPLYRPRTPSFRIVCITHSSGPRKRDLSVVCSRTLIVSKGWPTATAYKKSASAPASCPICSLGTTALRTCELGDAGEDTGNKTLVVRCARTPCRRSRCLCFRRHGAYSYIELDDLIQRRCSGNRLSGLRRTHGHLMELLKSLEGSGGV